MEKLIRMAIVYSEMSQSQVARKMGMSQQSFNAKLKRDTWTVNDLKNLACAIGSNFVTYFDFPDGKQIQ